MNFLKRTCIIENMPQLRVKKSKFGLLSNGSKVHLFTLSNGSMTVSATNYGCTLTSIVLPCRGGATVDVLLGFSTLDGFIQNDCCFGTIVGRFANRIGGASFTLDGVKYDLDKNDGEHTLHSGYNRFEKMLWKARKAHTEYGVGVEFYRTSYEMEQGFPGNVKISIFYTLNEKNELTLEYKATTDKATPISLTNHAYFNLKGYAGGSISDHELCMDCDSYLETDAAHIPTGTMLPVAGTPFDFTSPHAIGERLDQVAPGYDHLFFKRGHTQKSAPELMATVKDVKSGRKMLVKSTQPGVQLYTGNFITGVTGKNGFPYHNHEAFCLEAQGFPDAPNKSDFPSTILRPGEEYHQITQFCFEF